MRAIDPSVAVYLWQGGMDMRVSFDRLSSFVTEQFGRSALAGGVYVFFSRCRSRVKILYWDSDGFAIWHKRLEAGRYKVLRVDQHEVISAIDLTHLLNGTELSRLKFRKEAENGSYHQA